MNEVENQQHLANDHRNRHDIKNAVIGEVSEQEEMQGQSCTKPPMKGVTAGSEWSDKKQKTLNPYKMEDSQKKTDENSRIKQMQDPHLLMQQ